MDKVSLKVREEEDINVRMSLNFQIEGTHIRRVTDLYKSFTKIYFRFL